VQVAGLTNSHDLSRTEAERVEAPLVSNDAAFSSSGCVTRNPRHPVWDGSVIVKPRRIWSTYSCAWVPNYLFGSFIATGGGWAQWSSSVPLGGLDPGDQVGLEPKALGNPLFGW